MRREIIEELEQAVEEGYEVGTTLFSAKSIRSGMPVHVFVYIETSSLGREQTNQTVIEVLGGKAEREGKQQMEAPATYGVYRILDADVLVEE